MRTGRREGKVRQENRKKKVDGGGGKQMEVGDGLQI